VAGTRQVVRFSELELQEERVHNDSSTLMFELNLISVNFFIRNPYVLNFVKTDIRSVCFCK
jgi:hypothetical protein